jgi:hypothetical protein
MGEVHSNAYIDLQTIARKTINKIGYTKSEYQFDGNSCGIMTAIHEQSGDINRGVDREEADKQGAGDQGMMFGYAVNETESYMPVSLYLAHLLMQTLADIRRVADLMGGVRGVGIARKALRWVREGSRSPMETVVSNMLFLPSSEGGYGFAAPTLNHRVTLDDAASAITGTSCCYVDMSWPELRLGIEYDSSAWHADAEKDRRRREALAHMDWSIYSIQLDDVRGFVSLDRMVGLFAERVPRARGWQPASTAEQDQLLRRLFTSTRCGLGLERMLFGAPVKHGSIGIHL